MNKLLRGAVAGLAGTATLSAVLGGARTLGLLGGEWPPRQVSRNLEAALGILDDLSPPAFEASWVAQHVAYGMAAGVAFELVRDAIGHRAPTIPTGLAFGVALWAIGYAGWVPALGLAPPPTTEPRERLASEIVAHLVYGTTAAAVSGTLAAT